MSESAGEFVLREKANLRAAMKAVRNGLSAGERGDDSARIAARALELPDLAAAKTLSVYVSCRSEVHTHDLIWALWERDKIVTVPKVGESGRMEAHRIDDWQQLAPGPFGILAPAGTCAFSGRLDLCLTPGLAFTERGDRLGYGRGHYDRFLAARPELLAVGLAFDCQLIERIPTDQHDRPMNLIVTPSRVLRV